jgi:hypothetical protein
MHATSMRPGGELRPFFAYTGVPLGPLPMSTPADEPLAEVISVEEAQHVVPDVEDIVSAYCA